MIWPFLCHTDFFSQPLPVSRSMDAQLNALLDELYHFGCHNDQVAPDKATKLLNITPDTGAFLSLLIKAVNAQSILEIGTSNGYSTIWLADAARQTGGHVLTVEHSEAKAAAARSNFDRSRLSAFIELIVTDSGSFLRSRSAHSFDFIFLDADRADYVAQWVLLAERLRPGGLLIVDNAISHQEEMASFIALVEQTPGYSTTLVPVGKGEFLIWKYR